MQRTGIVFWLGLALFLALPVFAAGAEYPQSITTSSPFVNLPRPEGELWDKAFQKWDQRGDTEKVKAALDLFQAIADEHPENAVAWLWVGRAMHLAGMREGGDGRDQWMKKSAAAFKRSLHLEPGNRFAVYWRISAIVLMRRLTEDENQRLSKLGRKYDHLRELPVPDDDPLWEEAMSHWDKRLDRAELQKTIDLFHKLEKKYPERIEPLMWLCRGYYWMHYHADTEEDKAKWCWKSAEWGRKAVELEPRNPAANYWTAAGLGQYGTNKGYIAMARYALEMANKLKVVAEEDPNYYYGGLSQYFALAVARAGKLVAKTAGILGFSEDLILRLSLLAREYEPRYLRNTYALGELYVYQGKMDKAKKMLEETMEADPAALPHFEPDNRIAKKLARQLYNKHFK
ncbi:MAG: hypothetical protein R6V10_04970 [bacterium]